DGANRSCPPLCHPGTRQVIQSSLAVWPDDPNAGSVRYISGWMGTGKTTVAQTMANIWARQRLVPTYFFLAPSQEWFQTSTKLF
ncbi:hypothetical protein BDN72DRAFT_722199, partial [Pluteus cervinus]